MTLNNDTTIDARALDRVVATALAFPEAGSFALQQRFSSDPGRLYSAGLTVDARGQNSDRLMGCWVEASEQEPVEVFGACGAAAVYRREAIDAVGGLHEQFKFGLEDADVSWRMLAAGWKCMYVPDAVVLHDVGGTIAHGSRERLFQAGRNRVLLLARNLSTRQAARHLGSILAFDLLYVTYGFVRLKSAAPLRGRMAGLRLAFASRRATRGQRAPIPLAKPTPWRQVLARRRLWA